MIRFSTGHLQRSLFGPEPVIHDHQVERPILPKAAMKLSGTSPKSGNDRRWVIAGMAALDH